MAYVSNCLADIEILARQRAALCVCSPHLSVQYVTSRAGST